YVPCGDPHRSAAPLPAHWSNPCLAQLLDTAPDICSDLITSCVTLICIFFEHTVDNIGQALRYLRIYRTNTGVRLARNLEHQCRHRVTGKWKPSNSELVEHDA